MSARPTMHFELAHATGADGQVTWWLQGRFSDGRIRPCGEACQSADGVISTMFEVFGESFGAEHRVVEMPRVPDSEGGFAH